MTEEGSASGPAAFPPMGTRLLLVAAVKYSVSASPHRHSNRSHCRYYAVYDLLSMRRTVRIPAHGDDVNSCCWADTSSGNILISGSDDTFIKVWDRRSLGHHAKPAGVVCDSILGQDRHCLLMSPHIEQLVGHTEGITYVSSKGDGRYVISNGKDQSLRLWDLRKMRSNDEFDQQPNRHYGLGGHYDYRYDSCR